VENGEPDPGTRRREGDRRNAESLEGKMSKALDLGSISTRQKRIRKKAKDAPKQVLTSLAHNIDLFWMWEALRRTRKDGAPGVDGVTWKEYAKNWQENLNGLVEGLKSGNYRAPNLRRSYIPKGDGTKRPIAITTLEDKVLQRGVTMVLEEVYEADFFDFSYGYRPKRSPHQAIKGLSKILRETNGGWVLEVDVKSFFDTISHQHLREILDLRVKDGVIRRMIDKWLSAGILEEGKVSHRTEGTPQGGVISPILGNIFLHEVLDKWFVEAVMPEMKGWARIIRFADDLVCVFQKEEDAKKVQAAIGERFAKYGLSIHPEKTRLIDFRHPGGSKERAGKRPGTFDFLGFTFYWGKTRNGGWWVHRKTASKAFRKSLSNFRNWCKKARHVHLKEQWAKLNQKLRGYCAYYGIKGNSRSLQNFFYEVRLEWKKWLGRRCQRRDMNWKKFQSILKSAKLVTPRIVHWDI